MSGMPTVVVRPLLALLASLFALALPIAHPAGLAFASGTPYRGVNVYFSGHDASDPAHIEGLLDDLADMHVNTILLTFPIYIDSINGNQIGALSEGDETHEFADTPTAVELQAFIDPARRRGFDVWLRPLLDETRLHDEQPGSWRGMLAPSDPDQFFANYTDLMSGLVERTSGVSWLIIGTEFNSLQTERYDLYWERLISTLRADAGETGLRLSYAVNWDTGIDPAAPGWFARLDAISVDAYFPTGPISPDATADEIAANLSQWLPKLQAYRDAFPGLPLMISEVGVASQTVDPPVIQRPWYAEGSGVPPNPGIQARYAEGACALYSSATAADGTPLISGLFWWRTSVVPLANPLADLSHEFRGKPASASIGDCFASWAEP